MLGGYQQVLQCTAYTKMQFHLVRVGYLWPPGLVYKYPKFALTIENFHGRVLWLERARITYRSKNFNFSVESSHMENSCSLICQGVTLGSCFSSFRTSFYFYVRLRIAFGRYGKLVTNEVIWVERVQRSKPDTRLLCDRCGACLKTGRSSYHQNVR